MLGDPRSLEGLLSRGKNVYPGGNAPEGAGRPAKPKVMVEDRPLMFNVEAIERRLNGLNG